MAVQFVFPLTQAIKEKPGSPLSRCEFLPRAAQGNVHMYSVKRKYMYTHTHTHISTLAEESVLSLV